MDLDASIDELYALPPEQFTAARDAKVKAARSEGDRSLASRIGQLRRPAVSAWLVNQLARRRGEAIEELLALGEALREAQASRAGDEMRRLSGERHRIVSALVDGARQVGVDAGHGMTGPAEREVTATLEAALADPEAAAAVRSGQLAAPLRYSGFGPAGSVSGPVTSRVKRAAVRPADADRGRPGAAVDRAALRAARKTADEAAAQAQRAEADHRSAVSRQDAAKTRITELERQLREAREARSEAAAELKAATHAARVARRRADQARAAAEQSG